jgi:hypothetical protein
MAIPAARSRCPADPQPRRSRRSGLASVTGPGLSSPREIEQRVVQWVAPNKALALIKDPELKGLIAAFAKRGRPNAQSHAFRRTDWAELACLMRDSGCRLRC